MYTLISALNRHLRSLLFLIILIFSSHTAYGGVPTIDTATIQQTTATAIATAKSQIEAAQHYALQITQWRTEVQQYIDKFKQAAVGDFTGLLNSYKASTITASQDEMKKFIDEYSQSGNSRCNRMTQLSIKNLCLRKLSYQQLKLKTLAIMMDETTDQDKKIQETLIAANALDGLSQSAEKDTKMLEITAMQNRLQAIVNQRVNEIEEYNKQIETIQTMQAEVARTVMQGQSGGVIDAVISATALKAAFEAVKH